MISGLRFLRREKNQANEEEKKHSSRRNSIGTACAKALRHKELSVVPLRGMTIWPEQCGGEAENEAGKGGKPAPLL